MGLFSKILPALEVVAGAALMVTGVGTLAGAMLITSGLASSGLIGGSIGKFLNSGLGQGLMAAVSLGSTAYAMFGTDALQTSLTAMKQGVAEEVDKMGAQAMVDASQTAAAAGTADLAQTGVSFSESAGVNTAGFVDTSKAVTPAGVPTQQLTNSTAVMDNINPQANLAQTQALNTAQGAVQPTNGVAAASGQSMPGQGEGGTSSYNGSAPAGNTGQPTGNFGTTGSQPTPQLSSNMPDASSPTSGAPDAAGHADFTNAEGAEDGAAPGASSGWDKFQKFADTKMGAAAIQAGGSMVGGVGQGMMQQQAMHEQIMAAQQPNRSFGDPQLRSQVLGASAAPITVPQGYLQRAAALKTMLGQAGQGTMGVQPAPVPGH